MKHFLPILAATVLISCSDSGNKSVQDSTVAQTPPKPTIFDLQSYRPNIDYTPWDGNLNDAMYWQDSRGENVVVVSSQPQYFWEDVNPDASSFFPKDEDPETLSELAEIFVKHYVLKKGEAEWKEYNYYHDYIFGCCDVYMEYQKSSLQVVDADSNGTGEILLMYHETEGDGMIGHSFNGTLVLLVDSMSYTRAGATGLGNYDPNSADTLNEWVNPSEMSPAFVSVMALKWKELTAAKIESDREEVTERNNVDEDGHADHHH